MGCLTAKASGTVASFINPTVTDIESARVYFSPTQLGSGTPSPDNVREIVGRTGVELKQCGKNLIDINTATKGRRINIQGEEVLAADYYFSDYIPVLPRTQYYLFNAGEMAANACTGFYDSNKQFVGTTSKINPITTTDGCAYIRCSFRKENLQIVQLHRYDDIKTIPFSWKHLPDEYQEVEYIESTGTQQINTNIIPDNTIGIKTKVMNNSNSQDTPVFGTYNNTASGNNNGTYYHLTPYQSKWYIGTNGVEINNGIYDTTVGTIYNIDFNNANHDVLINGEAIITNKIFMSNYPLTISFRGSNANNRKGKFKYYYFKIYNNETNDLIADFIPCYRKSDNEIGMYDTVSQTFYTNQGTGTFLKGDDVFTDEVYGGYVDLVTGEVWADHAMFTVDEPNATCTLKTPSRLLLIFPLKYYFSAPSRKGASMCTMLPENASTNWNYGYVDNSSVTATTGNHQLYLNYTGDGDGWSELIGEEATVENVKAYLRNAGFAICATLRTPILMRTLTPTQLQTLKNENNIWSDADSVEIDYDLAETFDIQKAKRKIIMNQPHVETLTGDAVSFTTDMKAPLKECKVSFMPVQEGSGDPSPTNVRNIVGWNGVSVKNGENTYSIDWTDEIGTVYGGYVDLVKGELVVTNICEAFTSTTNKIKTYDAEDSIHFGVTPSYPFISVYSSGVIPSGTAVNTSPRNGMANQLKVIYIDNWRGTQYINTLCTSYSQNSFSIRMSKDLFNLSEEYTEIEKNTAINDYLSVNPIVVYYELATPITYQLTPQQILSLKGINNFSCGIKNDMNIKYWKHKLSDSTNIAYEAENLAFDGTNYIDTGVYLFSEKNINRDFEVVIEDLYGNNGTNSMTINSLTIVCAKYDSTAVGFLIRLNSATSTQYNGTIFMKPNNHNNITIKRINGVITIDGEVITNPTVKFTNAVHNHPLVLGCALQDDGTPYRYATGTIGHITIKWL